MFLSISFNEEAVMWEGEISDYGRLPRWEGLLEVHQADMDEWHQGLFGRDSPVSGFLTGAFETTAEGTHPRMLGQTLQFEGVADIRNGRLRRVNMIHGVLDKLRVLPDFGPILQVPEQGRFAELLTNESTPFERVQGRVSFFQKNLNISDLLLRHADYMIEGNAGLILEERSVRLAGQMVLLEELAKTMGDWTPAVKGLMNPSERIALPFFCYGPFSTANIRPDLDYVQGMLAKEESPKSISS